MSAIVPLRRSTLRRPLPSTGSRRVGSPASPVLRDAPTPCRPSRRTSLPSLGGTPLALAGSLLFVAERRHSTGQGSLINQSPRSGSTRGDDRALPGSWGTRLHTCPARRPRRDLCARPLQRFGAAFRNSNNVGSHHIGLSGLSHTACALAVYASSPASPLTAVGVGTSLAGRPRLGSRRTVLPYRALASGPNAKLQLLHRPTWVIDSGWW